MNTVNDFTYDRSEVRTGIAHIGVGNFHRAHEEYYNNLLLGIPGQQDWGICGIALLSSDGPTVEALRSQEGIYTLTVCGSEHTRTYRIGSLTELLWAVETPAAVIEKLADPAIRIITLTITEGGYNIDRESGRFILEDEAIRHDLLDHDTPRTVFGYVAAGLRLRMRRGAGAVTILSCDNLLHNGETARRAFGSFFEAQDRELAAWASENVAFPNSMVDRITPAVTDEDRRRLNTANGTDDKAPIYCEDFSQWVVEDKFAAGRPAWERVGVEFTADVTAYENMKLSLLNASHTMLAYPAFLAGYRRVDEAMRDERFVRYLRDFMDKDITPYVTVPAGTDLELYKQTLIERFGNRSVGDQLSRICFDGASKIPAFLIPNLSKMLKNGAALTRVAFFTAAYRRYLRNGGDDNAAAYTVDEPWLSGDDLRLALTDDPLDFLSLPPFASAGLRGDPRFSEAYLNMAAEIDEKGIVPILESILEIEGKGVVPVLESAL